MLKHSHTCYVVHLVGPDLHLHWSSSLPVDSLVERLIAVGLTDTLDEVLAAGQE